PCANVACPAIACGPGFVSAMEPGACCPVCKPIPCGGCIVPTCPSGSHLETPSSACCPICRPDSADECRKGQEAYSEFRAQLIEKYNSVGCNTAMDCAVVYESNRCVSSCGTAFAVVIADSAEQNLRSFAESNCASCPPMPPPPCAPSFVYCTQGVCTVGGP